MVLLLLLLIPLRGVFSDMTSHSTTSGGSILFQINLPSKIEINSIFWSKGKNVVAIVKPDSVKVVNPKFLNRVDLEQPILSLKLNNLSEEDGGIYEATIYTSTETVKVLFSLQVHANNSSHAVQWTGSGILLVIGLGTLTIVLKAKM